MGFLGDNEKKIEPTKDNWNFDLSRTDTQIVDCQFYPHSLPGVEFEGKDNDGLQYLQDTIPVDDVIPFDDAFETQIVDLGVETQVVDLCGETQSVDPDAETQVLDECDTEIPADSDGEESGETEVLCDTQVLSDDDCAKRGNSCLVDEETTTKTGLNKQGDGGSKEQYDAFTNGEHCSGSILGGFTSIRAASMRASGLAARKMALKRASHKSCSVKSGNSLEQQNAEKDGESVSRDSHKWGNECNQKNGQEKNDENMNESRNRNTRKVGSSTVRKLFMDDLVSDIRQLDEGMNDNDHTGKLPQFASENELGGLSYVNSQEPGESSQANALDVVENFLKHNVIHCDQDVVFKESTLGKSRAVSTAKGTQSLAKKATTKLTDGGGWTFNWDDNLEDEGGGEFFQKKKNLFFDNVGQRQQSVKHPKKLNVKTSMGFEENRDKEGHSCRRSKVAFLSDSRLLPKNLRLNGQSFELTEATFKRNLINDLDEEIHANAGHKRANDGTNKGVPEMLDVGFDTQMAADAMEILRFAVGRSDNDCDDGNKSTKRLRKRSQVYDAENGSNSKQSFCQKGAHSSDAAVVTRQSKKARIYNEPHRGSSLLANKKSKNARKELDAKLVKRVPKRAKSNRSEFVTNGSKHLSNTLKVGGQGKEDSVQVASGFDKISVVHVTQSNGQKILKQGTMQEQHDYGSLTPIARRTRGQMTHANSGKSFGSSREGTDVIGNGAHIKQQAKVGTFKSSGDKSECSKLDLDQAGKPINVDVSQLDQSNKTFVDFPRGRRTRTKLPMAGQEATAEYNTRSKRLKPDATSASMAKEERMQPLSFCRSKGIPTSVDRNTSFIQENVVQAKSSKHFNVKRNAKSMGSVEVKRVNGSLEGSPKVTCEPSASASTTPVSCVTPINVASPICMGDEYHKQSCRKNLVRPYFMKEINSLAATSPEPTCVVKDFRKRRDMANVRMLFSHHLDADIIKQQTKILNRLGASIASSMSDASHFITDEFVRTRNMLEAIAFGKPVVTHLWLESCGQASCFIDERNYILRDARKEKEFGFSMPVSLARASQRALLQGQRVLITPNTKPGKEILASLVKAVHGLAVERLGRSTLKDEKFPDDFLVLSCEEDYEVCFPFLEKGAAVYSSELLLNGIVTQRLEYERYRLFTHNVKRTRSTIWLRKNNEYLPVTKGK